jgi:hypothetical protein
MEKLTTRKVASRNPAGALDDDQRSTILSFITMRAFIGGLGALLPVLLIVLATLSNCMDYPNSISDYYFSKGALLFQVTLIVLALLFFTIASHYKLERTLCLISGTSAFFTAIVPTNGNHEQSILRSQGVNYTYQDFVGFLPKYLMNPNLNAGYVHLILALIFFASLATYTFFYMRNPIPNDNKTTNFNHCYLVITCMMVLFLILMVIVFLFYSDICKTYPVVFILETLYLWAFSSAWFLRNYELRSKLL